MDCAGRERVNPLCRPFVRPFCPSVCAYVRRCVLASFLRPSLRQFRPCVSLHRVSPNPPSTDRFRSGQLGGNDSYRRGHQPGRQVTPRSTGVLRPPPDASEGRTSIERPERLGGRRREGRDGGKGGMAEKEGWRREGGRGGGGGDAVDVQNCRLSDEKHHRPWSGRPALRLATLTWLSGRAADMSVGARHVRRTQSITDWILSDQAHQQLFECIILFCRRRNFQLCV